jgi:hypothetical protein
MIQQADTFVALWNENYANSTWCPNELEYARNRQAKGQKPTRIVLLTLDDTEVPIRFVDTLRLAGPRSGTTGTGNQSTTQGRISCFLSCLAD